MATGPQVVRAVDSETFLITAGILAPPLVCVSNATSQGDGLQLEPPPAAWFDGPTVFANAPFDLAVFCVADPSLVGPIFDALDAGRVHDVQTRQKLADLYDARFRLGTYSLAMLAKRLLGEHLEKEDTWRLRYHDLAGIPLDQWPADAKQYAIDDARTTLRVFEEQTARWSAGVFADEAAQVRAHFALHLMACRGMAIDAEHTLTFRDETRERLEQLTAELVEQDWLRPKSGGGYSMRTKALRQAVGTTLGEQAPLTPNAYQRVKGGESTRAEEAAAGNVKIDEDTLTAASRWRTSLKSVAAYKGTEKLLGTYLDTYVKHLPPPHGTGIGCVQPRFEILVETGRTSCRSPNIQNLPRDERVRRCFRARPGYVLIACDFAAAELHTLAQTCLDVVGFSRLAEALNNGLDPHLAFAAQEFLQIAYDEAKRRKAKGDVPVKDARQIAKAANFGFPGGLGALGFARYAAGYGVVLSEEESRDVRRRYDRQWPEVPIYHEKIKDQMRRDPDRRLWLHRSGRYRAGVTFTQAANTGFQGPAADGAKAAAWELARRCYTDVTSPLYGVRPVNFVHDEVIAEAPEDRAHEAAMEMERVMAETFTRVATPDVPCKAEATIMRSWSKADPVWRNGRLIPVEDT